MVDHLFSIPKVPGSVLGTFQLTVLGEASWNQCSNGSSYWEVLEQKP